MTSPDSEPPNFDKTPADQPPPGYQGAPQYPGQPGYPAAPPPYPGYYNPAGFTPDAPFGRHPITGQPYSDKTKLIAGLLQFFLGYFGVGRFYLGHTGIGLAQLFTCGGLGVWALIDSIMIFVGSVNDKQGRPLRDS